METLDVKMKKPTMQAVSQRGQKRKKKMRKTCQKRM